MKATPRIFIGEDTQHSQEAFGRAIESAKASDPNALVSRFDDVSFDLALLCGALRNQSIFGGRNIVVIDGILDREGGEECYLGGKNFEDLVHAVFIRETAPSKEVRALFKRIGAVEEFPLKKVIVKKNNFVLADAVAMRDKRSAWVEFTKLRRAGAAMEEVHGMVFWAVKMLYVCATQTKEEAMRADVKEFTYRTYQPRAKKFLVGELEEKLDELKGMYHRAHHGDAELSLFLEQFLLKL